MDLAATCFCRLMVMMRLALEENVAAATLLGGGGGATDAADSVLRLAFDGDSVLFSDEAEQVYQRHGLDAFSQHEQAKAADVLGGGPFKAFLAALQSLQQEFQKAKARFVRLWSPRAVRLPTSG